MMNPAGHLKARIKRSKTLYRLAMKAYSIRHPPPYRRPNMEFDFDAWNGISSFHYQGSRQIGEDNTGPYPYKEVTGNRYETCPFADSRRGMPMNTTNLRLVMPHAADAYQLTTALRNRYIAHRQLEGLRFDLVQAYLFSKFSVSLPAYLARRKDNPVRDGDLGVVEAAFYMLGSAPFMLFRQLMVRGDATPLQPEPMSGARLYELSDRCGVLISTRTMACPGSPKLIAEFFDVMMNGTYTEPLNSKVVQGVLELLGDWGRFYRYAHAASRLELLVKLNQAATASQLLALKEASPAALTDDTHRLLQSVLQASIGASYVRPTGERSESAILQNIVNMLFALLRDHGEESLDSLKAMSRPIATADPAETARRIRDRSERVLRSCVRDLHTVHAALGRSGWSSISEQDLLRRTGGSQLQRLLSHLESLPARTTSASLALR